MIAGGAFAVMAWHEAVRRSGPHYGQLLRSEPAERDAVDDEPGIFPASAEYYRILDAAWSAWSMRAYPSGEKHMVLL